MLSISKGEMYPCHLVFVYVTVLASYLWNLTVHIMGKLVHVIWGALRNLVFDIIFLFQHVSCGVWLDIYNG